ncbi:MAG: glycosyltransferase family 39 protein [Deltaproteobacteria bacterium]
MAGNSPAVSARSSAILTRLERPALGTALAVPWLLIWQGLDFTDQGYLLTGYRCFFRYPEATEDSANLWLTNFVGAIWDALFGDLGVLGMRALWALCMSCCVLLAFRLARALSQPHTAAVSALVASAFLSDRHATWFSYNALSTLIFTCAAVCLIRGIWQQRSRWLFGAGVLLGIGPFARLPNLLACALIAALGFAALLEPERRRRLAQDVGVTLLGIVSGVCGMLALIYAQGDATQYFRSVLDLFEPSAQAAGYSAHSLLGTFVKDQALALGWGLGVCLGAVGLARIFRWRPGSARWLVPIACACGVFVLAHKSQSWRWAVTGTTYLLLAAVVLGAWQRSAEQRVAAFTLLLLVVIAPLGSNLGIKNAHMGLWLALPASLALLHTIGAPGLWGQAPKLALIAGIVLGGEALYQAATYTYRDSARSQLTSAVGHPQLRGQYTSPARAKAVGEVLAALESRVAPGDYLLAYEGTPLLQYLTRTRPYLNRPWLMGYEQGTVVAELAREAPQRTGCLPVAVVTTKSARGFEWPQHAKPLEAGEPYRGVRLALTAFLQAHGYTRTWGNGFFEILEPPAEQRVQCR